MVPIYIPSYNRAGRTSTPALLDACGITDYKLVIRPSQAAAYAQYHAKKNLLVLTQEWSLSHAREYTRRKVKRGAWCLHMDDNVLGFIMPELKHYQRHNEIAPGEGETMVTRARWQKKMNVEVDFATFYHIIIEDTMQEAEKRGAALCGFSAHENPAFRARKWTDVGYVCGKVMLMNNVGLPWCHIDTSSGEDYALTAAHLFEYGRVLINKWGHPLRRHYMPGGCGPYEERLPEMQRAQQELTERYGALFGVKNANSPEKKQGELRLRFNSLAQVAAWRQGFAKGQDPNYR